LFLKEFGFYFLETALSGAIFQQLATVRATIIPSIRPAKPSLNAFTESLIGKLGDAWVNEHWWR